MKDSVTFSFQDASADTFVNIAKEDKNDKTNVSCKYSKKNDKMIMCEGT